MAAVSAPTDMRLNATASVGVQIVAYGAATVAFGQTLYVDTATNTYKLADCNNTVVEGQLAAIAITPGVAGGYGIVATTGTITFTGTTFVVGQTYCVGQTPGSIVPVTDLTTGDWVQRVGTAVAADTLKLSIEVVGVQRA